MVDIRLRTGCKLVNSFVDLYCLCLLFHTDHTNLCLVGKVLDDDHDDYDSNAFFFLYILIMLHDIIFSQCIFTID